MGSPGKGSLNPIGQCSGLRQVSIGVRCPVPVVPVMLEAGDYMEVKVGNDLPSSFPVGLMDIDSISTESLLHGPGDPAHRSHDVPQYVIRCVCERIMVGFGYHQGMTLDDWTNIHKGEYMLILIHLDRGDFSSNNLTKNAVIHGWGCSGGGR